MSSLAWPEMPGVGGSETSSDTWASLLKINADLFVSAPARDLEAIRTFESLALGFLPRLNHAALMDLARILAPCEDTPTTILDHLVQHSPETREIVFALSPRMASGAVNRLLGTPEGRLTLARGDRLDPFTAERLLVVRERAVEDALAANLTLDPAAAPFRELLRRARFRPALARLLLGRPDLTLRDEAALYLCADPHRRARIRQRLAAGEPAGPERPPFKLTEAEVGELFAIALRGEVLAFEANLATLFGFPAGTEWRLLELGRHDLLPLALSALGLVEKEAARIVLTLHPALSHSATVARALARVTAEVPGPMALTLVEAVLGVHGAGTAGSYPAPDASSSQPV